MKIENRSIGENNSRVCTISFDEKKLLTPFYFPSITSAETRSEITETIDFIIKRNYPGILVSCYDLLQLEQKEIHIDKQIEQYHQNGGIVLLDSGEFENFHFKGDWKFIVGSTTIKSHSNNFGKGNVKIGLESTNISNTANAKFTNLKYHDNGASSWKNWEHSANQEVGNYAITKCSATSYKVGSVAC